jgi:hypothetical protein
MKEIEQNETIIERKVRTDTVENIQVRLESRIVFKWVGANKLREGRSY